MTNISWYQLTCLLKFLSLFHINKINHISIRERISIRKRRFLDVVKEDMGEVGAKETDVEDRKMWRMMIRCGHS